MSYLYAGSLARFARNVCEGVMNEIRAVSYRQAKRALVEYAHLENFAEIVDLHLNPLDYEGFEVTNYIGFNEQIQIDILQGILSGNHPVVAARKEGVTQRKLETWMDLGSRGIAPFAGFFVECLKASGYASAAQMRTALEGGDASKAAIWWLKVMDTEFYGDKEISKTTTTINQTQVNNFMALKPKERYEQISNMPISQGSLKQFMREEVIDHDPTK